jgi:hypothetical protein
MPQELAPADSIASSADARPPASPCSWPDGGLDATWVHLAGELGIREDVT